MVGPDRVQTWRPRVAGVAEVLHAEWQDHTYPAHTHDTWTLLLVDDGLIGYQLDRRPHTATRRGVTLLPPHVVHDGHAATSHGFRKRVVYLGAELLGEQLVGPAVDAPFMADDALRNKVAGLDRALVQGEDIAAESLLALVLEGLTDHLSGHRQARPQVPAGRVAQQARDILDADPVTAPPLSVVADELEVSVAHLVRAFTNSFGIPPHRYLVGRRLDLARRRLLDGEDAAQVATETGFYDQAHMTRHFHRFLSTTPGSYQRGGEPRSRTSKPGR